MNAKIESINSELVSTRLIPYGSHRSFITVFDNSNSFNKTDFCKTKVYIYMPNSKKEDPFEDEDLNINSTV